MDSYRSVSVRIGVEDDLKHVIAKTGMKTAVANAGMVTAPGEPDDAMYLRQAEHLMRRAAFAPAAAYLQQAVEMNPASKVNIT